MNKKLVSAIVVLLVALAGVAYLVYQKQGMKLQTGNSQTAHQTVAAPIFTGQIQKIDGSSITASGFFIVNGKASITTSQKTVVITTDNNTQFIRTKLYYPANSKVGTLDLTSAKRTQMPDTLAGLVQLSKTVNGLDISVSASGDVLNSSSFRADSINYVEDVFK